MVGFRPWAEKLGGRIVGDIKLFKIGNDKKLKELESREATLEKELQMLFEKNLETLLGVTFIATEYSTGSAHSGRIDTLGLDENGNPVIIEYKKGSKENVINQGLFYLDWLMDHQGDFELLVMKTLGSERAKSVDWTAPRLVCVASDYTKYDIYAVQQIKRNIELYRYRYFGDELLFFELVNSNSAVRTGESNFSNVSEGKQHYSTVAELLEQADEKLTMLFEELDKFLLELGDDVQKVERKYYFAYKRIKNFASVEIRPQIRKLVVFCKVEPKEIEIQKGFTRDVTNIGHFGTGNLEITISDAETLEKAKPLLIKSYERS